MAETERESYVYVRLKRPEGYEDVHPELLVADANIHSAFEPEIVASHPEEAVAQRLLPAEQWVEEAERLVKLATESAINAGIAAMCDEAAVSRKRDDEANEAEARLLSHLRQPVAGQTKA